MDNNGAPMSATGRKNRDPNFTPEQLDVLCEEVNRNNNALFGKEMSKEEKEILWEEIAEKLNELDPKNFKRNGFQVKRKYIKFQSERRNKEKTRDVLIASGSKESSLAAESITIHQSDLQQAHHMSFLDVIGVIPDVAGVQTEVTHQLHEEQVGDTLVTRIEPINHTSGKRRDEFMREKIALQKVGLFMKMKKYQRMGHLSATDVRLITRWIKSPTTMPFNKK